MMCTRIRFCLTWWLAWLISTGIAATLRISVSGEEKIRRLAEKGSGAILLVWHNSTIIPMYHFRHRGIYAISSVSRDGELQSRLLASRGFKLIRGSSARRGVQVLLESARRLKEGAMLTLTPDGPRGPSRQVQPGSIQLAAKTGSPIVPVGVACSRGRRVNSWDHHLIPYPFARAAICVGEPILINLEERPLEEWRAVVRDALNAADDAAARMLGGRTV